MSAFRITEPGIYTDMPVAAYFADPCPIPSLTQSVAKILLDRSPAHAAAAHPRLALESEAEEDDPEKYDSAKAIGNAAHSLMIGRGKDIAVGGYPSWRSKEAKTFKADALAAGRTVILARHMRRAEAMANAARQSLDDIGWRTAFRAGNGEVVIAWREGTLWFRSLIDWMVTTREVVDLKTSAMSCAPHAIPMMMVNAGWDIQAAMQERGLNELDPEGAGRRKFRFVAQENEPPFALTPVELTEATLTMGRKKLAYAIDIWRRCMEADVWPSYPANICRPDYPAWKETQWLDREVAAAADPPPRQPSAPIPDDILAAG